MVRRWQQLPLDRASSFQEAVRDAAGRLLGDALPPLGPATALDQLRVAAYDACAQGRTGEALEALTALRRLIG